MALIMGFGTGFDISKQIGKHSKDLHLKNEILHTYVYFFSEFFKI